MKKCWTIPHGNFDKVSISYSEPVIALHKLCVYVHTEKYPGLPLISDIAALFWNEKKINMRPYVLYMLCGFLITHTLF